MSSSAAAVMHAAPDAPASPAGNEGVLDDTESRIQSAVQTREELFRTVRSLCDKIGSILNTLLPDRANDRSASVQQASDALRTVHTSSTRLQYTSASRAEAALRAFHHVAVSECSGSNWRTPAV